MSTLLPFVHWLADCRIAAHAFVPGRMLAVCQRARRASYWKHESVWFAPRCRECRAELERLTIRGSP
jgi:hypothetical protein